jgi:hypothetical protein
VSREKARDFVAMPARAGNWHQFNVLAWTLSSRRLRGGKRAFRAPSDTADKLNSNTLSIDGFRFHLGSGISC